LAEWAALTAGNDKGEGEGIAAIYAKAKQKLSLADIKAIKDYTDLPVLVKGVQSPADIDELIEAGADGIWVSNHGGRQVDGAPGSFDCLEAIAEVVAGRVPIIFDSGVRRGQHVFKALASGADIVAIGRPMLWGLSLGGVQGVTDVFNHLKKELTIDMQLTGCQTVEAIKSTKLVDAK
jgi:isopentenyl diphosphate isomerase/L-lactate dehydrogenase-like FMN-dependent dehydrogenase